MSAPKGDRHAAHARAEHEDEGERRQHDHPTQRRGVDRLSEGRQRHRAAGLGDSHHVNAQRGRAGDGEADAHIVVDAEHIGPQALIDFRRRRPADATIVTDAPFAVEVRHVTLSMLPAPTLAPSSRNLAKLPINMAGCNLGGKPPGDELLVRFSAL